MGLFHSKSEPPLKSYGTFNILPALILFVLGMTLVAYNEFYTTQLAGPFDPFLIVLALLAGGYCFWRIRRIAPRDPQFADRRSRSLIDHGALSACFALMAAVYLMFGLDLAERALNSRAYQPKPYKITGLAEPDNGRATNPADIQINPYGRMFPLGIAIPDAQYRQLKAEGVAGKCVLLPARRAIFAEEQIKVGCGSYFCALPTAQISPCPD